MRIPLASGTFSLLSRAPMRIIDLHNLPTTPVLEYQSTNAASALIGPGTGDSHIYWLRFAPGGVIGPHAAGPAQFLIPLEGRGWAAGPDAVRHQVAPGQLALIAAGELHSKGSDDGMSALMIQLSAIALEPL
jgi:quercetin dioxygenase-like cupin family protein